MAATPYPTEAFTRTDSRAIFGRSLSSITDVEISGWMKVLNSRFIVSSEPVLEERLQRSELFSRQRSFGTFSVFKLKDYEPEWIVFRAKDTQSDWMRFEDQLLVLNIENQSPGNKANLKIAYHPYWRADIDEEPVSIEPDNYGMMDVLLKEKGPLRLRLYYNSKNKAALFISFLSLVSALGMLALRRKTHA